MKSKYGNTNQKCLREVNGEKSCQHCRLTKPVDQYGFNKKGQYKLICNSCIEYLSKLSSFNHNKKNK
jgi:hypothetical protein